jgi:4-carboxymuconolactone decarboxylase
MKTIKIFLILGLLLSCLMKDLHAQQIYTASTRSLKHQHIITISAFTTKGDLVQLQKALADGLDAGLTINEIREVLVHLSAYTGFPRSLQGINTFMTVLETRRTKGIKDKVGRESTPVKSSSRKYEQGKRVLEILTGQREREPKTGYAAFAPVIDTFLKEHLFADMFGRDILSYTEREMATLSALITLGGVEPMMLGHMRIALHLGITETELQQMLSLLETKVGKEEADTGRSVLSEVKNLNVKQNATDTTKRDKNMYAKGVKAPAANFTGTVWVNMLVQPQEGLNCSAGVVTFEPGARTNWHRHPGGQVLMITEGKGYYQERGLSKRVVQKGDVVKCLPGIEHWHGASSDTKLTHIAISPNVEKGNVVWLQTVTDEEYNKPK